MDIMKKTSKKVKAIGILIAVAFITLIGMNALSVKAGDSGYVTGNSNMNNTESNSAKVGDSLKDPEKGWKRYDNSNTKIQYSGVWEINNTDHSYYNSNITFSKKMGDTIKFKFCGTKLRIITDGNTDKPTSVNINIDGENYFYSQKDSIKYRRLSFEKLGLNPGNHNVVITVVENADHGNVTSLDAIDIDENGELLPYEESAQSITLDKTSMNLLESNSEKLTATVLPEDTTNKKVLWTSSNESVATVDENGNVTAVKEGQATIMAKVEGTELTATCIVNVTKAQLPPEQTGNAILSITLVNGTTKQYDVSMTEVGKFMGWYETRTKGEGSNLYAFPKKESPYKEIKEYIAQDKIASFEVKEYISGN